MTVIELKHVSKWFYRNPVRKLLRDQLVALLRPCPKSIFYALQGVTLKIERHESVAIIGHNGAGKSTLLSLITGLASPDDGFVRVNGRAAALLELGSGFHPDLTGLENITLNAALLGFREAQLQECLHKVVDFSELGQFINEPIRTFSSGMVVRLAFSVAVHMNPDLLIVDEVLGVGDLRFQEKCSDKIKQMRRDGATLLCVSHSSSMIETLCERAIWLHEGRVLMDGSCNSVVTAYNSWSCEKNIDAERRLE